VGIRVVPPEPWTFLAAFFVGFHPFCGGALVICRCCGVRPWGWQREQDRGKGGGDGHCQHHAHGDAGAECQVVEDTLVDVIHCRCGDAAAEEGLFSYVNDMADVAAEGGVRVRQELVGFVMGEVVAGPGT